MAEFWRMENPIKVNSAAVVRSGLISDGGSEVVVACGYTLDGRFGYFIIDEAKIDNMYHYGNQYAFFAKQNEQTYQEAVRYLHKVIHDRQIAAKK